MIGAFEGRPKEELLAPRLPAVEELFEDEPLDPRVDEIAGGSFREKDPPEIEGTGYVVDTLEVALWALARTTTFEEDALDVVNLANDADTTGAVYGQVAGAFYGEAAIPGRWRERFARREEIPGMPERQNADNTIGNVEPT